MGPEDEAKKCYSPMRMLMSLSSDPRLSLDSRRPRSSSRPSADRNDIFLKRSRAPCKPLEQKLPNFSGSSNPPRTLGPDQRAVRDKGETLLTGFHAQSRAEAHLESLENDGRAALIITRGRFVLLIETRRFPSFLKS